MKLPASHVTDVIRFLSEECRLVALATGRRGDPHEVHTDPVLLGLKHTNSDVLVARQQNRGGHGPVASKVDEVRDDQGVDALLGALSIDESQPQLDIALVGQGDVPRRWRPVGSVVPVDSQERQAGQSRSSLADEVQEGRVRQPDLTTAQLPAAEKDRSGSEQVTRIDEHTSTIHRFSKQKKGLIAEPHRSGCPNWKSERSGTPLIRLSQATST